MNEQAPQKSQDALLVILVALIVVGASWFLLGGREPTTEPAPPPTTVAEAPTLAPAPTDSAPPNCTVTFCPKVEFAATAARESEPPDDDGAGRLRFRFEPAQRGRDLFGRRASLPGTDCLSVRCWATCITISSLSE